MSRDDSRAPADGRPVLVTGGAGFIGSNIADRLAGQGHRVIVYDALARFGVERNLAWLRQRHGERIVPLVADIRDEATLGRAVGEAKAVFHMAAQVAVTTSLVDPRDDYEVNLLGTFGLLQALRAKAEPTPLLFASTNKVYGGLDDLALRIEDGGYAPVDAAVAGAGISERRPLDFHTPYGCSKGAADQYVLDHARSYGLPAAVLRMSCVYGRRQMGNEDQGWVAHFLIRALRGEPITLYGDGRQVRDLLDVSDAVDAYLAAWARIDAVRGRAFNLGGGPANAVSLRALIGFVQELLGRPVAIEEAGWRAGDQRWFVADTGAVRAALGLGAPLAWREGVARLLGWLREEMDAAPAAPPVPAALAGAAA